MTHSGPDDAGERFSLVVGGPFHAALRRLGLAGADRLPTRRAAISLGLLAWLPPALPAIAQSRLRVVPVDAVALIQLGVAAGVPLLAAIATQVPLVELVQWIVGTIL